MKKDNLAQKEKSKPHLASSKRNSGIELLKICAIFLIVISHFTQTLHSDNIYLKDTSYILHFGTATRSVQLFILSLMGYSGSLGNTIFFVCSAWFLIDSSHANKKKIIGMETDIWVVSILFLIVGEIILKGRIDLHTAFHSLFPTTYATNWYLTCYLLFYAFHPFLNRLIRGTSQKEHFRLCLVTGFLYLFMNFIRSGLFFTSMLIVWITIYFFISYAKWYLPPITESLKINLILALGGIIGNVLLILLTNIIGLSFSYFTGNLFCWNLNNNPFTIISVFGLVNLARKMSFKNKTINYLSSLSLLIYITHENVIFRHYFRPLCFSYINSHFGYTHIIAWIFALALSLFVLSAIVSTVYKETFQRLFHRIISSNYNHLCSVWKKIENKFL